MKKRVLFGTILAASLAASTVMAGPLEATIVKEDAIMSEVLATTGDNIVGQIFAGAIAIFLLPAVLTKALVGDKM